ncbi:putative PAAR motif protein [Vibrio nigripulchritudo SFn27]|uniref:Putative PAAR motif protein n=1 Tax=Vibrio nigripulchritudo TaxID=28173 RepID=U4K8C8_9VIBR|nr:PAAR domain-containing protein [Vibrio nigripulchritudo]CCN84754.1 putative PAAR motif protein [Vibrio nigripulchritudo BLFn1]CCN87754.1 putative PAAR motif protein [Vibrio nigripulchritudo SFn27]CCN95751.1 putative PAAR motif protein [Vibrio nigripulchritudo ENn2]CCO38907.1 putative PAAR motif protein [Vibrio nigripulchritudo SFn135]CCO51867.1 putative PAAR motif protein [Vibrio nigripulchritudo Wn13]
MSKPAARVGDAHSCPDKTGRIPHVGCPVAAGSSNVLINSLPAARQGDMAVCIGPPDSISAGSSSVFINGLPAARMGDGTAHGGVVASGSGNVFIGDSGITVSSEIAEVAQIKERAKEEERTEYQSSKFFPIKSLVEAETLNLPMLKLCSVGQ